MSSKLEVPMALDESVVFRYASSSTLHSRQSLGQLVGRSFELA